MLDMTKNEELIKSGRRFLRSNWETFQGSLSDQSRGVPAPPQQKPCPAGSRMVALVPPERLGVGAMPLIDAIRRRRSRRKYGEGELSLEELSFLLWATQGVRERGPVRSSRTVPSGGSRHGLESYLYVARVKEVDEGLYRYQPLDHALCHLRSAPGMREELDRALDGQYWNAAAVFVWTVVPYRMEWRYTVVSHKILALDAGHVCQNLYLACEAIGCGTCAIGAYDQAAMDRFLGVDGSEEAAIYAAPVGKAISSGG
jgi:SagB-type dehydrogenase family enzyme